MLNTSNVHKKLIKTLPTLSPDDLTRIKILNSYEDAILLSNNDIIDLAKYDINITHNDFELNLPSNKSNDVFYFDAKTHNKNYFEVSNFKYTIQKEYQQQLKYYKINIDYNTVDNIKAKFFILEYEYDEITNIIQVENNITEFQTLENTEFFKVYIKLEDTGLIYNIDINVVEKYRNILNEINIKFGIEEFYNTAKEINITPSDEGITINIEKNNKKDMYISYLEKNNKFTLLPEHKLFDDLSFERDLMTSLQMTKDDTLEVIPMLIEYNATKKTNIKNVSFVNQEILHFKNDTCNLRFVLRVSGVGEINLKSLSLMELEKAPTTKKMDFDNRKDVISITTPKIKLIEYKVACIMDEFTYNSFAPEVQLYRITPGKWKSELLFVQPDLLFIESAWAGNDGKWNKKVAYYDEEQHFEIKSLIKFAQSLNIPVVFWNKEDPVHYSKFIETAKLCDYVFTTDKGRIPEYIKDCGHEKIRALPFAAQPKNHNPIKIQSERDPRVSFAGSYYRHHEERSKDMDVLLEASKQIGLVIYDRNYEKTSKGQMPNHKYPERYNPYIKGNLPFNLIDKSYKGYKYMINVNTVKYSETMFSRRVFEGLISGTPIISTYSLGMKMMFGDIIESSSNIDDLRNHLKMLDSDALVYNKYAVKGIREVLLNHTYEQRMKEILNAAGYTVKSNKTNIYFIAFINEDNQIRKYIDIFHKQTVLNKKLVLIHKNIKSYKEFYNNYNTDLTIGIDYNVLKKYINIRHLLGHGYISVLNSNNYYSENYALDLVLAKEYSNADIIGKSMYYSINNNKLVINNKNSDFIYTPKIKVDRAIMKVDIFDKFSVESSLNYLEENTELETLMPFGAKLYSSDSLNFIENGIDFDNTEKIEI